MKILSMNICGFGGLAKQNSLGLLLSDLRPDLILLQETMCSHAHALYLFSTLKPGWEFCASDACGLSGGLLAGWDPHLVRCKDFSSLAGIVLKATFKGMAETFTVINCYGPYIHRTSYWNSLVSGGILGLPNLLLDGDLNFTLSSIEVWGQKARLDPLASYFSQLISGNKLVDLSMDPSAPT